MHFQKEQKIFIQNQMQKRYCITVEIKMQLIINCLSFKMKNPGAPGRRGVTQYCSHAKIQFKWNNSGDLNSIEICITTLFRVSKLACYLVGSYRLFNVIWKKEITVNKK